MSPVSQLSVLAFASAVLASPYAGHGHGHAHAHRHLHTGSGAPFPYPGANSTRVWGTTGTGAAPSYASETAPGYDTMTNTVKQTSTFFKTVYETVQGAAATSNVQVAAASASDVCGADVTVTNTEKVYVTVTAGGASSSSAPAAIPYGSSSSVASPVQSSSSAPSAPAYSAPSSDEAAPASTSSSWPAPAYSAPSSSEAAPVSTSSSWSAPAYSAPSSESSSVAAPVTTSSYVAPSSSAPAYTPTTETSSSSSVIAILPSMYSVADKGSDSMATSSAAPAYSSTASSSGGKRGLAYNDASLTDCFSGSSEVSWAYNWISSSGGLTGYNYIPTLHSTSEDFLGSWVSDVETALTGGSTTLFSFNEPDISSQANMDVASAVSGYKDHMAQFSSKAKLCAPSVSNSGEANQGLDYLQQFIDQCGDDCAIDCLNIHWYATCDSGSFIDHVKSAVDMLKDDQTLYISEFGVTDGSDSDIASFLEDVMAYMDGESKIAGYAYFMVEDGKLVTGNEPSTYGSTYKTYTS